jgi:pimeloyl-ACP methyl ester carboxylesterase
MKMAIKVAMLIAAGTIGFVVLGFGGLLGYRASVQHHNAQAFAITTPDGIDEATYVAIGGIRQWIYIRGQHRSNTVILCLHGGPGGTWTPLIAAFLQWENDFTVVQWDQRGAGKTLETTRDAGFDTVSIARVAQDGIELTEFLRRHLHKDKIVLLGHSWGSIVGIHMVKQRPDLFSAYIGTGQVSDMTRSLKLSYQETLAKARAANDAGTINALTSAGPPPYPYASMSNTFTLLQALGAYAPQSDKDAVTTIGRYMFGAPNFSLRDIQYRTRGFMHTPSRALYDAIASTDLSRLGFDFEVPIYVIQGASDNIALASLAEAYFNRVRAPRKAFVTIEGGGHFTFLSMPDRFFEELKKLVGRPSTSSG